MIIRRNTKVIYILALVVIVMAFFLLGGGAWIKGITNGNNAINTSHLHWGQILISLGLGFLLGWIIARKKL
jgi:TRAP-type C4-dicarboxylate transport system permease small subunit